MCAIATDTTEPANDNLLLGFGGRRTGEPRECEPSFIRGDEHLWMLDIHEADGTSRSLPYASIHQVYFNPSTGIKLIFGNYAVELGGINLRPLYDAINTHTVKRIMVLKLFELLHEKATVVDSCQIQFGEPKELIPESGE